MTRADVSRPISNCQQTPAFSSHSHQLPWISTSRLSYLDYFFNQCLGNILLSVDSRGRCLNVKRLLGSSLLSRTRTEEPAVKKACFLFKTINSVPGSDVVSSTFKARRHQGRSLAIHYTGPQERRRRLAPGPTGGYERRDWQSPGGNRDLIGGNEEA